MGRRRNAGRDEIEKKNEWNEILSSLLDLLAEEESRRCLLRALNNLSSTLQRKAIFASEDDWLLQVEQSATQVRESCKQFRDDGKSLREEVYHLLCRLEETSQAFRDDGDTVFDPVCVALVCRSFRASYRLQAQMNDEIVQEILSFLSTLYVNIEFAPDSNEEASSKSDIVVPFSRWMDHLESQAYLNSTPWQEALEELQRLCACNVEAETHHYVAHELETVELVDQLTLVESAPPTWLKNEVGDSQDIMGVVEGFLGASENGCAVVSFLLLVGQQGSGKTHLCDEIEKRANTNSCCVHVIRPTLPIDFMGASLGEAEDIIASIFGCARKFPRCILLLDDIDRILGQQDIDATSFVGDGNLQNNALPHSQTRFVSSFLSQIDSFAMEESVVGSHLLIIGTASNLGVDSIGRVDMVFFLDPPDDIERREMILRLLAIDDHDPEDSLLLADLVECTVGRTRSELVQYCRQSIASWSMTANDAAADGMNSEDIFRKKDILRIMKVLLQSLTPESLRSGAASDFVDMAVLPARDLLKKSGSDEPQLELFGKDAYEAWEEMKALIVMPLCQSNALDELLYGAGSGCGKTVCGGALLVGKPGCGKTALAYHCARVAANLVPSVILLDVSCTSLVHKEVGGSERALRQLFTSARAAAPCILIMDNIENIAAVRGHDNTTEGTMDRILSTLLIELDGVESQAKIQDGGGKIAVIGITHNEQWIDPAIRRSGRLEKVIRLENPDHNARYQIVLREVQSVSMPDCSSAECEDEMELARYVADRTDGLSGAEVIALCSNARMEIARESIRQNKDLDEFDARITREHFVAAGIR